MSDAGAGADSPGSSRLAFLFADPAAHSLSPDMHRAAFAWAGLSGDYQAQRVSAEELPAQIQALRERPEVLGVNLSLPHKEAVLPLLDNLSNEARQIGAVNTVVSRGGRLAGHNTDAAGLWHALEEAHFLEGTGPTLVGPVVVLGAGGAARAAVYTALVSLQRDVFIVNRTRSRAEELAAAWQHTSAGRQVRAADVAEIPWADVSLIINSSSAGLNQPTETPLPDFNWSACPRAAVYDMVYKPAQTRLMREARAAGRPAENGLGMLAQQARLAFGLWTGVDVPAHIFLKAAQGRLA